MTIAERVRVARMRARPELFLPKDAETWAEPGPRRVTGYVVGVDLGQSRDWTALVVLERAEVMEHRFAKAPGMLSPWDLGERRVIHHAVRFLHRPPLGTPYPAVVEQVRALLADLPPMPRKPELVVDATGVGRPVLDMMRHGGLWPVGVTITGGQAEQVVAADDVRVPKRTLAALVQVILQTERLKIAPALPLAPVLVQELRAFQVKINASTGAESFEAWRDAEHDDLVLAVALACWQAERQRAPVDPRGLAGLMAR